MRRVESANLLPGFGGSAGDCKARSAVGLRSWGNWRALDFIRPGKPVENGFIEGFNGRLRDECLNTSCSFRWAMPGRSWSGGEGTTMSVVPTVPCQEYRRWNTFGRQRTNETGRIGQTPKTAFRPAHKAGARHLRPRLSLLPAHFGGVTSSVSGAMAASTRSTSRWPAR
jgi:hypothetical protein